MFNASIRAVRDVRFMADHEHMEHAVRSISTTGEPCEHDDEGHVERAMTVGRQSRFGQTGMIDIYAHTSGHGSDVHIRASIDKKYMGKP